MELYEEILSQILAENLLPYIQDLKWLPLPDMVENRCYQALERIRDIVREDSLDDAQCLLKIDEIICAFEEIGSSGGNRHDFG